MIKNKTNYLYFAFIIELFLVFYFRNKLGFIVSPVLLLIAGLFLSIYPYFLLKNDSEAMLDINKHASTAGKKSRNLAWIIFGSLSLLYGFCSYFLFVKYPIDIHHSDIIPFINEVMVKRFLHGEMVYAPVAGFTSYVAFSTPNYLPLHWIPFIIPALLNIDSRWIIVFIFILSAAFYLKQNISNFQSARKVIFITFLPFAVVFTIFITQAQNAVHTVEIMIMGYYLFLSSSLFSKSSFVKASGITFPALSRYAFLFWLPVFFYGLLKNNLKRFFIIGFLFALFIFIFFIIPFVLPIPEMLKTFNSVYIPGAVFEWKGQAWQHAGDRPFQLFQGTGFASWFYMFYDGTLEEKVSALKNTLMTCCILSAVIPIVFYKKLTRVIPENIFSLLALKYCLTIFYALILVPYVYLFWVPSIVSVVIISRIGEGEIK